MKIVVAGALGHIGGTSPGMRFHTAVNKLYWQVVMGIPFTVWRAALHQKRQHLELGDSVISNEKIDTALGCVKGWIGRRTQINRDYYKHKLDRYLK